MEKEAYFIKYREPGETVPVRCLYVIPKKNLEEIFTWNCIMKNKYDTKLKCEVSSNQSGYKVFETAADRGSILNRKRGD